MSTRTKTHRAIKGTLATPAARRREVVLSGAGLLGTGHATEDATGAIGVPGNLNISGFLTGEDYNPAIDGYQAYTIWDEMRRSDAQVNATLLMCKLPIKAAKWKVRPQTSDPQDQAIADFVQAAMLDDDSMSITWSDVLDNALLKLDFGSSAHEKIWTVDEVGALRFARLAPRLPKTFYRWIENDVTGQLEKLQQFAPKAGRYGFFDIEVDRLILHVLNREGNNWYGRSVLRAAYPNWFYKKQLYRIGAVGADRELQGIPIAKLGQDYSETIVTLDKIETTLKGLRSYDRAYVISPYGVEFGWLTSDGAADRLGSLVDFIEHHNVMIARNILQQFSAQGSQPYGSKGASEVTFGGFYDALEGVANEIATEFRQQAVKPLCEANFDMTGRSAPKLVPTDLGKVDSSAIAENMSKLSNAKLVTPDDDLEDWFRELNGAPKLPDALKGRDRVTVPTLPPGFGPQPPAPPAPADGGNPNEPDTPNVEGDTPEGETNPKLVEGATGYEEDGQRFGREPTLRERQILALQAIPAKLDDEKARLARELAAIRITALKKLAPILAKKDARDTAPFTDLRKRHLPAPNPKPYVQAIRAAQTRMLAYGREQVHDELARQDIVQAALELAGKASAKVSHSTSHLVSSAQATGQRLADQWQSLALENAIRLRRSGLVGDALSEALEEELADRAESGVLRDAASEVNEAFGMGRSLEASARADEIGSCEYSAVLDNATCETCRELDGTEYASPDDAPDTPNPDCDGGDACRCVILFLAASK